MTGRRIFFLLALVFGLTIGAGAAPLIVQISPSASINSVVAILGGTLVDNIPGTTVYLLNVPVVPSSLTATVLGIQWMELNEGVTLPSVPLPLVLTVPGNTASDWYKYQPPMVSGARASAQNLAAMPLSSRSMEAA